MVFCAKKIECNNMNEKCMGWESDLFWKRQWMSKHSWDVGGTFSLSIKY